MRNMGLARAVLSLAVAAGLVACSGTPSSPSPVSLPNRGTTADLTFCVSETNRYRAMVSKSALAKSASVETFAAAAAETDTQDMTPHSYYLSHLPGGPSAENEAPDWSLRLYGSVQNAIAQAIAAFWSEGPGGAITRT